MVMIASWELRCGVPEHFINLSCTNCGAKLDVYEGMERFACGYCGTELIVQRRGGTVALRAVMEAVRKVRVGTDKTAAGLAIARYESELNELRLSEAKLSKNSSANTCTGVGCGGTILVLGLFLGTQGTEAGWWLVLGCVALGVGLFYGRREGLAEQQRMRVRIRQLEILVAEKKRIADS
jgi:DNA-directed RNA polymerase subunit RPC12/RpoP